MPLAALLALVFGFSAVAKAKSTEGFRQYLEPIAGASGRGLVKVILAVEVLLAAGLLVGVVSEHVSHFAGAASACFLVVATLFHGFRMVRGNAASCHCFGGLSHDSDSPYAASQPALFATRNAALTVISVWLAGAGWVLVGASAMLIVSIIGLSLVLSIRRERTALRAEMHPKTAQFAPTMANLQAHGWWVNGHPRSF